jgi:hypothetical protein
MRRRPPPVNAITRVLRREERSASTLNLTRPVLVARDASGRRSAGAPRRGDGARGWYRRRDSNPAEVTDAPRPREDGIEVALASALRDAATAAQWEIVAQLARELEARRAARGAS